MNAPDAPFTDEERQRYARHLALPGFGPEVQNRLRAARVAVVGCGGLGSPALLYLAAAGVGALTFLDGDTVAVSNLQRQLLHTTHDIGRPKTDSATDRLRALNPHVRLAPVPEFLTPQNAGALLDGHDLVLDATDTYSSKYLVNDACCRLRIPFVHAGLSAWSGQLLPVVPGRTPCLRCVFPDPPPAETGPGQGPVAPLPGVVGAMMALEAIKLLAGLGPAPDGTLLAFDARAFRLIPLQAARSPDCPACASIPPDFD